MASAERSAHSPKRSVGARVRKVIRIVALAALGAELFYVAGMNLFLSTPLFGKVINGQPEVVDIHYTRAWSLFPTRIHAEQLSIRGTDSHVEWDLHIDDVDFGVDYLGLAHQYFHATWARGSGIAFHARIRVALPAATDAYDAELPPVVGLPSYSVLGMSPPYPGTWSDKDWNLWTITLENIVADHVRELWINDGRFVGDARIAGGFHLKPIREVEVGPAHIDVRSGETRIDSHVVASEMKGTIDYTLARFDPRTISDADLLHHMTAGLDLRLAIPELRELPRALVPEGVAPAGRVDVDTLRVRLDQGVIHEGTLVAARSESVRVAVGEHAVSLGFDARAEVARRGHMTMHTVLSRVDADGLASVETAVVDGDSSELDLAKPLGDLHLVADVPAVVVPDAKRAVRAMGGGRGSVRVLGGRATAALHGEAWLGEKRAKGDAKIRVDGADVQAAKVRAHASASASVSVASLEWEARRARGVRGVVDVDQASLALGPRAIAQVNGAHVVASSEELSFDDPLRTLDATVAIAHGEVREEETLRAHLPEGMHLRHGAAGFHARGELHVRDHRGAGALDVQTDRVGVAYRGLDVAADVAASLRVHGWDAAAGRLGLDRARVVASGVVVTRQGATAAAITMPRVSFDASSPRFALADPFGHVHVTMVVDQALVLEDAALGALLPAGSNLSLASHGGTLSALATGDLVDGVATGRASLRLHAIGLASPTLHATGDVEVDAIGARLDVPRGTLDLSRGRVALTNVEGGIADRDRSDFTARRIEIDGATSGLDFASPSLTAIDAHAVLQQVEMKDARVLNAILPGEHSFVTEGGRARLDGDLSTRAPGRALLLMEGATVRLNNVRVRGDFGVDFHLRPNLEHDEVAVGGTRVRMRDVSVMGAATSTRGWAGEVIVQSGAFRPTGAARFEAEVTLEATDARPALALLLGKGFPKSLVTAISMPNLSAAAHVHVEPEQLRITDAFASGGNLSIRAIYISRRSSHRGAIVVEKGALSAGLRLDDEGSHVHLFNLRSWFAEQRLGALRLSCGAACETTTAVAP